MNRLDSNRLDIADVARACLPGLEARIRALLPDGHREGHEWIARNPRRSDRRHGSFCINLRTGRWGDFATGDKGGDFVSLHAYVHDVSQLDAAREIAHDLGLTGERSRPASVRPAMRPGLGPVRERSDDEAPGSAFAGTLWSEAVDPRGTLAERYLVGRGLSLPDDCAMRLLRFHPDCPFGKDDDGRTIRRPCLLIAFRSPRGDPEEIEPPVAIHRVGLNPDGSKIGKLMLGPAAGLVMKVSADETVEGGLGLAEGFETALAVRLSGWEPIWAAGSAGAMKTFAVLPGISNMTVFADPGAVGEEAARACAERWAASADVTINIAPDSGDWAEED